MLAVFINWPSRERYYVPLLLLSDAYCTWSHIESTAAARSGPGHLYKILQVLCFIIVTSLEVDSLSQSWKSCNKRQEVCRNRNYLKELWWYMYHTKPNITNNTRLGGLMVGAFDFGSSGPSSSCGLCHCVVFFSCFSHSVPIHQRSWSRGTLPFLQ